MLDTSKFSACSTNGRGSCRQGQYDRDVTDVSRSLNSRSQHDHSLTGITRLATILVCITNKRQNADQSQLHILHSMYVFCPGKPG